ncbi:MAG: DUF1501 domain-containing protein [Betaproteobacteria bacterium]|nr:DUF1501 domain-containing protein [Betaproteobacteria bacterium]
MTSAPTRATTEPERVAGGVLQRDGRTRCPRAVTAFTASDFGRDLPANGNGGSDHGWGQSSPGRRRCGRGRRHLRQVPRSLDGPDDSGGGRWIPTTRSMSTAPRSRAGSASRAVNCQRCFRTSDALPTTSIFWHETLRNGAAAIRHST